VFERWWDLARRRYLSLPEGGHPERIAFYYDPIIDYLHPGSPQFAVYVAFYLAPQKPDDARRLFRWAAEAYHWTGDGDVRALRDPRVAALGLVLAKELGETTAYARLGEYAERMYEPHWDHARGEFAWGFGLGETVPRGQLNAVIMTAEVGAEGAWSRIFNRPNLAKFGEPTVCGVEYPALGIARARYDAERSRLTVTTCAGDLARRGARTSFRVRQLPDPARVRVSCDGQAYGRWRPTGPDEIAVEADLAEHTFVFAAAGPEAMARR
jgi:hypothetical protein